MSSTTTATMRTQEVNDDDEVEVDGEEDGVDESMTEEDSLASAAGCRFRAGVCRGTRSSTGSRSEHVPPLFFLIRIVACL